MQGSVLTLIHLNLVMIELLHRLNTVKDKNYTFYANDVTMSTTKNASIDEMQDTIQRAVQEVVWHLEGTGLVCFHNK